jgi:hypothetical protein
MIQRYLPSVRNYGSIALFYGQCSFFEHYNPARRKCLQSNEIRFICRCLVYPALVWGCGMHAFYSWSNMNFISTSCGKLAVTKERERSPCAWGQAVSTKHRDPAKENQKLQTTFLTFTTQEQAGIFTQIWTNEV